jgi:hypothetical protein
VFSDERARSNEVVSRNPTKPGEVFGFEEWLFGLSIDAGRLLAQVSWDNIRENDDWTPPLRERPYLAEGKDPGLCFQVAIAQLLAAAI